MTDLQAVPSPRAAPLQLAFASFLRLLSACALLLGIFYWVRLIGVHEASTWRFDLMPFHWQVASSFLAVLFPFAAVGLWLMAPWGPVLWFACAGIETVMYGVYPNLYGKHDWTVVFHFVVLLAYVGFRIALFVRRRRRAA